MRHLRIFRMAAGSLMAFTLVLPAQTAPPSSQSTSPVAGISSEAAQAGTPEFRSVSNLVVVDVVVTREGQPIKGLQRQAFHVLEDGREQNIKVFEEHTYSQASHFQWPLPADTYSNSPGAGVTPTANILLLDALNTPGQNRSYVRQQMIEYLKSIPPGSHVAIFTLASKLRFVEGLMSDAAVLQAALQKPATRPEKSNLLDDRKNLSGDDADPAQGLSAVTDSIGAFEADTATFQANERVQITLGALKELAHFMETFPGRKNLLWFSGSFPLDLTAEPRSNNPFWGHRGYASQLAQVSDLLRANRIAVYPLEAGVIDLPSSAGSSLYNEPQLGVGRMGTTPMSAGVPGRALAIPFPGQLARQITAEHATMRQIAEQTGGVAFYDASGFSQALAKVTSDGANYYSLGYSPDDKQLNGRFRKVEVRLPDLKCKLAFRRGYFADPPDVHANLSANSARPGSQPAPLNSKEILFEARVVPLNDTSLQTQRPSSPAPGALTDKLKGPVRLYSIDYVADTHQVSADLGDDGRHLATLEFIAAAYDSQGKILNYSDRTFKMSIAPSKYDEFVQSGWPMHQELAIPKGDVYLRLAVRDAISGRLGSMVIPLKVEGKAKGE